MNLNIDFEQLRSVSAKISDEAGNFTTLLQQITATSNDLKWVGGDATSYTNALKEQETEMTKLATAMNEISEFLLSAANAYEEVQNSNTLK